MYLHSSLFGVICKLFHVFLDTGIKPLVKNDMKRHVFLSGDSQSYLKTEAQWVDYGQCMGFRFNISGLFTKLTSYLCLMEENGHCMTEVFTDTEGQEMCKVVRPWSVVFY